MAFDWKITWRNLLQDKAYVLVNLISLSVTIACSLILLSYIVNELSYDKHFPDHERIFRITTEIQRGGNSVVTAGTARVLAPYLVNEYPRVIESYVRLKSTPESAYAHDDIVRDWDGIWFADPSVFAVFNQEIIHGNPGTALNNPNSMAVSENFSQFYFGSTNPIGSLIEANGEVYEVTLVYKDLPENTHLRPEALISANGDEEMLEAKENPAPGGVFGLNVITYVKLSDDTNASTFEAQMAEFYSRIKPATLAQQLESELVYRAQPLASIHYASGVRNLLPTGNISTIYAFTAILIALIVVSSANYTNLALAKIIKNANQIGTLKIIGAQGNQLSVRIVLESLFQGMAALVLALCLIELLEAITPLAEILGRKSLYDVTQSVDILLWSVLVIVALTMLSSVYPAFYLSAVSPLVALKAHSDKLRQRVPLQRVLLSIQLFISVAILATTLLMNSQISFLLDKPLGANYSDLINVKLRGVDAVRSSPLIASALKENPMVVEVSVSSYVLGDIPGSRVFRIEQETGGFDTRNIAAIRVDSNFLDVLKIPLIAGRNFQEDANVEMDQSVIVNETFVREQGWVNPIGKNLGFPIEGLEGGDQFVVGVIEDFHISSLHSEISPIVISRRKFSDFDMYSLDEGELIRENLLVRHVGDNVKETLEYIELTIRRFAPNYVLDFEMASDKVESQYLEEVNQMAMFGVFALISIFLSCLGIFGLMSFNIERRIRELSIRRIIGATLIQINNMLSKEYFILLAFSAVPASVIAYLAVQDWLSLFAYYASINFLTFIVATVVVATLVYCVISIKLFVFSKTNLAEKLRCQ